MATVSVPTQIASTPTPRGFSTLADVPPTADMGTDVGMDMRTPHGASVQDITPTPFIPNQDITVTPIMPNLDITATAFLPVRTAHGLSATPSPIASVLSATPPPTASVLSATPSDASLQFGLSVEGRELIAYRIGNGARAILLVGAVHGGYEANTAQLMEELAAHFRADPSRLPPDITLWIVPALNPDGIARGRVLEGRFNANTVDLNRNWPCGWQPTAYFREMEVSAGAQPLSEPETKALSDLIISIQPAASLFFHAAAAGVYSGTCGGDSGSGALSAVYGEAADYSYGDSFSAYPVTGTAPAWVNSLGFAAADVELASAAEVEFDRNLAGVTAALCWVSETC